jgi:hypothetical protein
LRVLKVSDGFSSALPWTKLTSCFSVSNAT